MRSRKPASVRILAAYVALLTAVGLLGAVPETLVAAEPDKTTSTLTEAGFRWLVKQQQEDGSWDFNTGRNPSTLSAPTVGTALAVWPLLRSGQTPEKGVHAQNITKGLAFIQSRMKFDEHGCHAPDDAGNMYGHAIITAALCEAYSRTQDPKLQAVAQGAVDYIVHAQDPAKGGWRYQPQMPGDTSVTGWQLQALAAAAVAKLKVPEQTIALARKFLDLAQVEGGGYAYVPGGPASPTMSLVGLFGRASIQNGQPESQFLFSVESAAATGPTALGKSNLYYDYYGTLLMKSIDGSESGTTWNKRIEQKLIQTQETQGDDAGSWFYLDVWSQSIGRFGMTTFSLLILTHTPAAE